MVAQQDDIFDALGVQIGQTKVIKEVKVELNRQLEKWGHQSHSPVEWQMIESEEFLEATREAFEWWNGRKANGESRIDSLLFVRAMGMYLSGIEKLALAANDLSLDKFETEMIQVAAVAIAAVESTRRQRADGVL